MLRSLLEMWDFEVAEACGGQDSVHMAADRRPDLILMDTELPFEETLNDMALMKSSTEIAPVPVIVLSGFSKPEYRDAAISQGAADFLVKPVDFDTLEQYLGMLTRDNSGCDGGGVV